MGIELVTIVVNGMRYTAFEEIEVTAAFNQAARSFSFTVAAELGASATNNIFGVGAEVSIFANTDLLLSGYVDAREPEFAGNPPQAQISVAGRSKSADLIDSSAKHETGHFEKKDPQEIGAELSQGFGASIRTDRQLEKLDLYQLTPGASVFREVERLARQQGMTLTGTAEGDILITNAGSDRHAGGLIEGVNILRGRAAHNGANRHSEYTFRGQRPFDHGKINLEIEAEANDAAVERYRPFVGVIDEDTNQKLAESAARNRMDRAAGNALKANITTQGFRDDAGMIWTPGRLVWTESPFLDIAQDMLIERVQYSQSENGSTALLSLTDPRSYGGKGGKGNKSGPSWKRGSTVFDSGAAPVPYL